ncbi:MAG: hypothetical protein ACLFWG_00020 [Longimicrobiales bacterium]
MASGGVITVDVPCGVCGRPTPRYRRVCRDCAGTANVGEEPELRTAWGRTRARARRQFLDDLRAELGGELPFSEHETMRAALWMDREFSARNREQDYRRGVEMVARASRIAAEKNRRIMDALYWIVRDALDP